ncbi:PAS domain-containing sensor histidine kinase [Runella sp.]|uniref:PAS domain-containing sensor histidine kinase n=1 Tax=Runella sp. TaxID=1960881 RepID=UPI003D0E579B
MLEVFIQQTQAMRRHVEMLNALFKSATEGIIVVDSWGEIQLVNPKAQELFGYEEGELLGKKIETLIPQRYAKKHVDHRMNYAQQPKARNMGGNFDLQAKRKDNSEFPVEVSLSPFSTSDGDYIVSFIIDISLRKKQELALLEAHHQIQNLNTDLEERVQQRTRELAEAMDELEQSKQEVMRALEKERQLNDMKTKFVTIASHEFRTPLATILSSASLIGRYIFSEENDKRQKHVQRIKSTVNNLTEILNDFLSLGKLEEGQIRNVPVVFNLPEFCKELVDELRSVCKENQQLHYFHEGIAEVTIDRHLLKNILINLISNAAKYSEKDIFLRTKRNESKIMIEVQDQGIGIPEQDQPHVFDRFFRAHNSGTIQGTGLGLNIVYKYVQLMQGEIKLESKLNTGTRVYLELPT